MTITSTRGIFFRNVAIKSPQVTVSPNNAMILADNTIGGKDYKPYVLNKSCFYTHLYVVLL